MSVMTIREAVSQALWEEMEHDPNVIIMGEEVGVWVGTYAVTKGFYDHFGPERVRDTPISEGVIVGAAVGAAMNGLKPVAEIMTINFAFLALDQIVNQAAKIHSMFGGQFKCRWSSAPPPAAASSWAPRIPRPPMSFSPTFPA